MGLRRQSDTSQKNALYNSGIPQRNNGREETSNRSQVPQVPFEMPKFKVNLSRFPVPVSLRGVVLGICLTGFFVPATNWWPTAPAGRAFYDWIFRQYGEKVVRSFPATTATGLMTWTIPQDGSTFDPNANQRAVQQKPGSNEFMTLPYGIHELGIVSHLLLWAPQLSLALIFFAYTAERNAKTEAQKRDAEKLQLCGFLLLYLVCTASSAQLNPQQGDRFQIPGANWVGELFSNAETQHRIG